MANNHNSVFKLPNLVNGTKVQKERNKNVKQKNERSSRLNIHSNDSPADMINYQNGELGADSSLSPEDLDAFGHLNGMNLDEKNFQSRASRMIMQFQQWTGETNSASTPERKGIQNNGQAQRSQIIHLEPLGASRQDKGLRSPASKQLQSPSPASFNQMRQVKNFRARQQQKEEESGEFVDRSEAKQSKLPPFKSVDSHQALRANQDEQAPILMKSVAIRSQQMDPFDDTKPHKLNSHEKPTTRKQPYKFTPLKHISSPTADKLTFKKRESQYHLRGKKITHEKSASKLSRPHQQTISSANNLRQVSKKDKRMISQQLNLPIFANQYQSNANHIEASSPPEHAASSFLLTRNVVDGLDQGDQMAGQYASSDQMHHRRSGVYTRSQRGSIADYPDTSPIINNEKVVSNFAAMLEQERQSLVIQESNLPQLEEQQNRTVLIDQGKESQSISAGEEELQKLQQIVVRYQAQNAKEAPRVQADSNQQQQVGGRNHDGDAPTKQLQSDQYQHEFRIKSSPTNNKNKMDEPAKQQVEVQNSKRVSLQHMLSSSPGRQPSPYTNNPKTVAVSRKASKVAQDKRQFSSVRIQPQRQQQLQQAPPQQQTTGLGQQQQMGSYDSRFKQIREKAHEDVQTDLQKAAEKIKKDTEQSQHYMNTLQQAMKEKKVSLTHPPKAYEQARNDQPKVVDYGQYMMASDVAENQFEDENTPHSKPQSKGTLALSKFGPTAGGDQSPVGQPMAELQFTQVEPVPPSLRDMDLATGTPEKIVQTSESPSSKPIDYIATSNHLSSFSLSKKATNLGNAGKNSSATLNVNKDGVTNRSQIESIYYNGAQEAPDAAVTIGAGVGICGDSPETLLLQQTPGFNEVYETSPIKPRIVQIKEPTIGISSFGEAVAHAQGGEKMLDLTSMNNVKQLYFNSIGQKSSDERRNQSQANKHSNNRLKYQSNQQQRASLDTAKDPQQVNSTSSSLFKLNPQIIVQSTAAGANPTKSQQLQIQQQTGASSTTLNKNELLRAQNLKFRASLAHFSTTKQHSPDANAAAATKVIPMRATVGRKSPTSLIVNGVHHQGGVQVTSLNRNFTRSLLTEDRLNQIMLGQESSVHLLKSSASSIERQYQQEHPIGLSFGGKLKQTQSVVEHNAQLQQQQSHHFLRHYKLNSNQAGQEGGNNGDGTQDVTVSRQPVQVLRRTSQSVAKSIMVQNTGAQEPLMSIQVQDSKADENTANLVSGPRKTHSQLSQNSVSITRLRRSKDFNTDLIDIYKKALKNTNANQRASKKNNIVAEIQVPTAAMLQGSPPIASNRSSSPDLRNGAGRLGSQPVTSGKTTTGILLSRTRRQQNIKKQISIVSNPLNSNASTHTQIKLPQAAAELAQSAAGNPAAFTVGDFLQRKNLVESGQQQDTNTTTNSAINLPLTTNHQRLTSLPVIAIGSNSIDLNNNGSGGEPAGLYHHHEVRRSSLAAGVGGKKKPPAGLQPNSSLIQKYGLKSHNHRLKQHFDNKSVALSDNKDVGLVGKKSQNTGDRNTVAIFKTGQNLDAKLRVRRDSTELQSNLNHSNIIQTTSSMLFKNQAAPAGGAEKIVRGSESPLHNFNAQQSATSGQASKRVVLPVQQQFNSLKTMDEMTSSSNHLNIQQLGSSAPVYESHQQLPQVVATNIGNLIQSQGFEQRQRIPTASAINMAAYSSSLLQTYITTKHNASRDLSQKTTSGHESNANSQRILQQTGSQVPTRRATAELNADMKQLM